MPAVEKVQPLLQIYYYFEKIYKMVKKYFSLSSPNSARRQRTVLRGYTQGLGEVVKNLVSADRSEIFSFWNFIYMHLPTVNFY